MVRHFVSSASFETEDLRKLLHTLKAPVEGSAAASPPPVVDTPRDGPSPWLPETITQMNTPPASSTSTYPASPECANKDLESTLMVDAMNIPRACIIY